MTTINNDPPSNDTCAICMETLFPQDGDNIPIIEMGCCHIKLHKKCVDTWFAKNSICPHCRTNANVYKNSCIQCYLTTCTQTNIAISISVCFITGYALFVIGSASIMLYVGIRNSILYLTTKSHNIYERAYFDLMFIQNLIWFDNDITTLIHWAFMVFVFLKVNLASDTSVQEKKIINNIVLWSTIVSLLFNIPTYYFLTNEPQFNMLKPRQYNHTALNEIANNYNHSCHDDGKICRGRMLLLHQKYMENYVGSGINIIISVIMIGIIGIAYVGQKMYKYLKNHATKTNYVIVEVPVVSPIQTRRAAGAVYESVPTTV